MKETFWSKLRELWAIRRRCQQIKLRTTTESGFRDQMNFMAERSNLLKLYRQKDARLDQPDRAPDSHRGRRSPKPLSLVYSCLLHFIAAIRGKRLNFQHRFLVHGAQFRAAASLLTRGAYRTVICIR